MARARAFRPALVDDLAQLKRWLHWWHQRFDQPGTVHDPISREGRVVSSTRRKRRPDEYHAADPEQLRMFAQGARDAAAAFLRVAEATEVQADALDQVRRQALDAISGSPKES